MPNLEDRAVVVADAGGGIGLASADTLLNANTNVAPADLHQDKSNTANEEDLH